MILRKYRWSRAYESAEEELIQVLASKHIEAERWSAEEGEALGPHAFTLDKRVWCAEGMILFTVEGKQFSLQPGDTLDIPANTTYEAVAGFGGCACYESPAPASNPVVASH